MSTYSPSLRIELPADGTQAGTWGDTTNSNLAYILDTSVAGYQTVSVVAASQALTFTNGPTSTAANNQAVYAMLRFTTTTGAASAVYAPPASKMYIIWNNSGFTITIYNSTVIGNTTAAGTGVAISNNNKVLVWSDGTSFYEVQASNLTGTLAIANGGTGQITANAALNALLPVQTSNANKYLQTDGTNSSWDTISLSTADITGTLAATNGGTGQSTVTTGDLLYGSATNTWSKLADVATGNALISGGVTTAPTWGKIGLTTHVSGTLPVSSGGTGQTVALTQYGVIYGSTTTAMATTLAGTSSQVLHGNASGAPSWGSVALGTEVSGTLPIGNGGTNITTYATGDTLYSSAANTLATLTGNITATRKYLVSVGTGSAATAPSWDDIDISTSDITGTLAATNGGTGQNTVTTGDLLYGSAANTWAKLADVATGNALISGGIGVAPLYGKIGLTTHVSGTLAVGNGGTGATTSTGTGAVVLATSPSLTTPILGTPQSGDFSTGTFTWPTFNQNTTGSAGSLSATLAVSSGGTGNSSQTQYGVLYAATTSSLTGNPSLLSFDGTNLGIGTNSPSTYGKLTVLGTGSFTNSLVSTSTTVSDKPTFEFRKTRNTAGGNENNAIGRLSFYSQNGTTTTESAFIDVTDTRLASLPFPRISIVSYNDSVGANVASLTIGGTQTRLFSSSSSGIDYDATSGDHTFSGDVVFNDAVTATTFSGNATTATTATTATALSTASGSAPSYSARAWVCFDGTGTVSTNQTILANGNIATAYKNGSGDYTLTFTTAMQDANYAIQITNSATTGGGISGYGSPSTSPTAAAFRIVIANGAGAPVDSPGVYVTVFR